MTISNRFEVRFAAASAIGVRVNSLLPALHISACFPWHDEGSSPTREKPAAGSIHSGLSPGR
jgi:hypothetical protein